MMKGSNLAIFTFMPSYKNAVVNYLTGGENFIDIFISYKIYKFTYLLQLYRQMAACDSILKMIEDKDEVNRKYLNIPFIILNAKFVST